MSGFGAEWLALREPYDARARNPTILDAAVASLSDHASVNIADLACGTGSTLRVLSRRVTARQNWRLVDNDLGLLARAAESTLAGVNAVPVPLDLYRDLEAALDGPLDLVTVSALLDLVSEDWLERLVVEIAARQVPLYVALTYDGRIEFDSSRSRRYRHRCVGQPASAKRQRLRTRSWASRGDGRHHAPGGCGLFRPSRPRRLGARPGRPRDAE